MLKRRAFLKRTALGAAALLASPTVIRAVRAADAVTVLTPFGFLPDFIEIMNAKSGGHFANFGLDANVVGGHGGAQTTQEIVAGRAQFARGSGVDLLSAMGKQQLPVVSISTLYQGATFQLLSLSDKPIRDGKDLKGKTVGLVSVGGSTDTFLTLILAKVGLSKDDVKRQVVGNNPGAVEFIRQGRIDCFICSINVVITLERTGVEVVYWSMDKYAPMPGQIYMASRDTVATKSDLTVRFLRAMKASVDEIMTKPLGPIFERAAKDFEIPGLKNIDLPVAVEQASINQLWLTQGKENLMRNVPTLWQSGVDSLHAIGLLSTADATLFYSNKFIDEALKS